MKFSVKPEQTYGLVVGIEKYQENSWNVDGQVNDALKFAQWLSARGVPRDNIRLCLSPLEENGTLAESTEWVIEEATESNITTLITDVLSEKKGDLLYLFWAGHGLITSTRNRRLLCANATKRNWQNLDLDSLLVYLSSDSFKISHHICIIDACANYILESNGRPTNLGRKTFPSGKPRTKSQQFVLLATREGEQAKVNTGKKTGYFSQAVMEALADNSQNGCLPNMETIAQKVKQQLTRLDKKQLPTYFYRRSWDGDTDIYHPNPFDIPHNIPNSTARKLVGRELEIEQLHQLLQDNPVVTITDFTGQGGVGKTELAIQYSWRYLEDYPGGCCWLKLQGAELETQLIEFALVNFSNFNFPDGLSQAGQVAYCWRNWQPVSTTWLYSTNHKEGMVKPNLCFCKP
ncbi:caspase family protein [Coleofasciculus sp.]|uniref:caspase family protein n=1 Tax=Coleofasciculus sp. TaxID=3100458 RepID=UPI0039F7D6A1